MMYRFLPPLLLLFGIHTVFAKDLMIDYWSVSLDREPLPQQSVNVGDTVTFKVLGAHDVFIHPSLSCDKTDIIEVPTDDNNLVTYTFQESDSTYFGKTMFFTCDAGTHCEMGQSITFRVYPAPQTSAPTTSAPTATPIEPDPVNKALDSLASRQLPSLLSAFVITVGTWYCWI